jgi:pre-mRNA-splicing factor ATP-dependent RNA helicase DHX16
MKRALKVNREDEKTSDDGYGYVFESVPIAFDEGTTVVEPEEGEGEAEAEAEAEAEREELAALLSEEEQRVADIEKTRQSLPITAHLPFIWESLTEHSSLVLVGETGSGKTTQLPQYLAQKVSGMVACTQPRRVAATSVATRVADEVGCKLGGYVGYSVRFDDKSSDKTQVKYLTDGMLVREAMSDPLLSKYSVVMVDEAHERTINTDVLLGLLRRIMRQRSDLKVVVASATLDAGKFSRFWGGCPVYKVPGRRFEVSVYYARDSVADYVRASVQCVLQILQAGSGDGSGDILVFLPGAEEIHAACEMLLSLALDKVLVCPLYAALPAAEQGAVFAATPPAWRKVVVATNIAETSLTIEGIVAVVDCGLEKQRVRDTLSVVACSRAAADQRAGRAGRVRAGRCFRLYTRAAFLGEMPAVPTPEMLRTDLDGVLLSLLALGVPAAELSRFPWVDRPAAASVAAALETLYALGAVGGAGALTTRGVQMAALPTPPALGRALVEAGRLGVGVLHDVCVCVAMLEEYPLASTKAVPLTASLLLGGDPYALASVYWAWEASGRSRAWTQGAGVDQAALVRVRRALQQLQRACQRLGVSVGTVGTAKEVSGDSSVSDSLRVLRCSKALCAGLVNSVGRLSHGAVAGSGSSAGSGSGSRSGLCYRLVRSGEPVQVHGCSILARAFSAKGSRDDAAPAAAAPPATVCCATLARTGSLLRSRCFVPVRAEWVSEYAVSADGE